MATVVTRTRQTATLYVLIRHYYYYHYHYLLHALEFVVVCKKPYRLGYWIFLESVGGY
jgi:hypothetical protein